MSTPTGDGLGVVSPPGDPDAEQRTASRAATAGFCILVWRFRSADENVAALEQLLAGVATRPDDEPKCLFRRVARNGNDFQVRVGLEDSFGVLTHVSGFASILKATLQIARLEALEVHGAAAELAALHEPLAPFRPAFYVRDFSAVV